MTGFIGALVLIVASPLLAPLDAQRADGRLRVEYTVEVKDTSAKLFHVTATFSNLRQPRLDLSLPVWTPGWYTIENYGKNILRFEAKDGSGSRLPAPLSALQSWSVDTRGTGRVTVEFDYHANVLAVNQAKRGLVKVIDPHPRRCHHLPLISTPLDNSSRDLDSRHAATFRYTFRRQR
ncbi:MAG: hypothetical protein ABIP09_08075 [Gemmatimonadaceae bacterium]